MKTPDQMRNAAIGFQDIEKNYAGDWQKDAEKWEQEGLYAEVADMVNPVSGRWTADIGTGAANQLCYLGAQNPQGLYVGTERTSFGVYHACKHLEKRGVKACGVDSVSLAITPDDRLFWMPLAKEITDDLRVQIRVLLQDQFVIIGDDIRHPQILPALLNGEKLEAAILSLPGGSAARAYEWPYAVGHFGDEESLRRQKEAANDTRKGFYHYSAQAVRDGGKVVIVERASMTPDKPVQEQAIELIGGHMGPEHRKYWKPGRIATRAMTLPANVDLQARHDEKQYTMEALKTIGHRSVVVLVELFRTSVPFSEPPRPAPEAVDVE